MEHSMVIMINIILCETSKMVSEPGGRLVWRPAGGFNSFMNLVKMLKAGDITSKDIIFFEDMFQPGMEALPYILQQTPAKYLKVSEILTVMRMLNIGSILAHDGHCDWTDYMHGYTENDGQCT